MKLPGGVVALGLVSLTMDLSSEMIHSLLPVFLVTRHHLFMKYLIKTFDHAGKLLALVGVNPVRDNYIIK